MNLTLQKLKREVLSKGEYLSIYTRIRIVYMPNIIKLLKYLKETADFYRPLYKDDSENPYLIARRFLKLI